MVRFRFCFQKKSDKTPPKLTVQQAVVKRTFTFLDFITSGTQLNCTIAIDFTGDLYFFYIVFAY